MSTPDPRPPGDPDSLPEKPFSLADGAGAQLPALPARLLIIHLAGQQEFQVRACSWSSAPPVPAWDRVLGQNGGGRVFFISSTHGRSRSEPLESEIHDE